MTKDWFHIQLSGTWKNWRRDTASKPWKFCFKKLAVFGAQEPKFQNFLNFLMELTLKNILLAFQQYIICYVLTFFFKNLSGDELIKIRINWLISNHQIEILPIFQDGYWNNTNQKSRKNVITSVSGSAPFSFGSKYWRMVRKSL